MIQFNCQACGIVLQAPDDRAGTTGRCKVCGGTTTVPHPTPVAADGEACSADLLDILDRQAELSAEMIAYQLVEPWLAGLRQWNELNEAVVQEDDSDALRALISQAIDALGPAPAAEARRAGRVNVVEATMEANDGALKTMMGAAPGCRQALRPLRASPRDETDAREQLPDVSGDEADVLLGAIAAAHSDCWDVWNSMLTDDDWTDQAGAFARRAMEDAPGAVEQVVDFAVGLGRSIWEGFTEETAGNGTDDDGEDDGNPEWVAAVDALTDAWIAAAEAVEHILPSTERACRHVLGGLFERAADAVERLALSAQERTAISDALASRLRETEAEYAELTADNEDEEDAGA